MTEEQIRKVAEAVAAALRGLDERAAACCAGGAEESATVKVAATPGGAPCVCVCIDARPLPPVAER